MLTLEEATWNLDGALTSEKIPLYRRKRIRAAVRDVTLAAVEEVLASPIHSELDRAYWKAEIIRRFGPEKAGE